MVSSTTVTVADPPMPTLDPAAPANANTVRLCVVSASIITPPVPVTVARPEMKALVWFTTVAEVIEAPSATPSPLIESCPATTPIVASLVDRTVTICAAVTVAPSPMSAVVVSAITATEIEPPIAEFSAPVRPTVTTSMSALSLAMTLTLPPVLSALASAMSAVTELAM